MATGTKAVVRRSTYVSKPMKDLLAKVKEDVKLREKMRHAVDIDRIAALSKEAGVDLSADEISQFLRSRIVGLTDQELEQVAGAQRRCGWTCTRNSRALC